MGHGAGSQAGGQRKSTVTQKVAGARAASRRRDPRAKQRPFLKGGRVISAWGFQPSLLL